MPVEVQRAALNLELEGHVAALVGRRADLGHQRQRNPVDGRRGVELERALQGADRCEGLQFLRLQRLAGRRIGVAERPLPDLEGADRQVQAAARRTGRLGGARAGMEFPVRPPLGVGFQDEGGPEQREPPHLDAALQQGPEGRGDADPAHIHHLGALGADRIGEMNLPGADAQGREDRELERALDHELAAGRLLHGCDHRGLVLVDVQQGGRREADKRHQRRKRHDGHSGPDPGSLLHGK